MTGVKKVGDLEKDRERARGRDSHSTREPKALVKNESKQAAGSCPASGRSPPDGPVLQSAKPGGRPRPPRSFEICQGCPPRRPRPGRPASLAPEAGNSGGGAGRAAGGGRRGFPSGTGTARLQKSAGEEGEAPYRVPGTAHPPHTYQEISASHFPPFNVRIWFVRTSPEPSTQREQKLDHKLLLLFLLKSAQRLTKINKPNFKNTLEIFFPCTSGLQFGCRRLTFLRKVNGRRKGQNGGKLGTTQNTPAS